MQNMFDGFGFTVLSVCLKQVRHMQKAGSFKTDVYESTLHARKNTNNSPPIDISNNTFCTSTFNVHIQENLILDDRHSSFS